MNPRKGRSNKSANKLKLNLLLIDTGLTHIINISERDQSSTS